MVSPVARNVNHSFILRTETVRSPMVRVCWAVSLDGKGHNVTKVKAQLFISTMYFIFVNCISKCINLVCRILDLLTTDGMLVSLLCTCIYNHVCYRVYTRNLWRWL